MLFNTATPGDRYSAAHEHFSSSGFSFEKIILVLVLLCVIGVFVYFAYKKDK